MIKVEIEIEQLPARVNGRVRGKLQAKSRNYNATEEEMRMLDQVANKLKEIAQEIGEHHGSEVAVYEKPYVRHRKPANHR